jgi:hypothetical protein
MNFSYRATSHEFDPGERVVYQGVTGSVVKKDRFTYLVKFDRPVKWEKYEKVRYWFFFSKVVLVEKVSNEAWVGRCELKPFYPPTLEGLTQRVASINQITLPEVIMGRVSDVDPETRDNPDNKECLIIILPKGHPRVLHPSVWGKYLVRSKTV